MCVAQEKEPLMQGVVPKAELTHRKIKWLTNELKA